MLTLTQPLADERNDVPQDPQEDTGRQRPSHKDSATSEGSLPGAVTGRPWQGIRTAMQ